MRWLVSVVGLFAFLILIGCGGDQQTEPAVTPTIEAEMPTPSPMAEAETPKASAQAYWSGMRSFASDFEQIFGTEWPEAIGLEPFGEREWQDAVSRLAARIDGMRFRMEELEPPKEYRVSHNLIIASLSESSDSVRQVRIAGAVGDIEGLKEALAIIEGALALIAEAVQQLPDTR